MVLHAFAQVQRHSFVNRAAIGEVGALFTIPETQKASMLFKNQHSRALRFLPYFFTFQIPIHKLARILQENPNNSR